jgi:hypothetical protein
VVQQVIVCAHQTLLAASLLMCSCRAGDMPCVVMAIALVSTLSAMVLLLCALWSAVACCAILQLLDICTAVLSLQVSRCVRKSQENFE